MGGALSVTRVSVMTASLRIRSKLGVKWACV